MMMTRYSACCLRVLCVPFESPEHFGEIGHIGVDEGRVEGDEGLAGVALDHRGHRDSLLAREVGSRSSCLDLDHLIAILQAESKRRSWHHAQQG